MSHDSSCLLLNNQVDSLDVTTRGSARLLGNDFSQHGINSLLTEFHPRFQLRERQIYTTLPGCCILICNELLRVLALKIDHLQDLITIIVEHMANRAFPRRNNITRLYRRTQEEMLSKSIFACVAEEASQRDDAKPAPRSGHRVAADEANLYSYGGYNPNANHQMPHQGLYRELWRYNFASRTWTLLKEGDACPEETASHSMILLGTSLLVAFGTGFPFGEKCSNNLHVYHIPGSTWRTIACGGEAPSPRYGQSMTYKDGSVFVMGGTTGFSYNMKVYRLNLETLHWEDTSPPTPTVPGYNGDDETPAPRYRHEVASSGNWLYVLGGGTAQHVFSFETIPAYNTQTRRWANMSAKACPHTNTFPIPRKFHAAVQFDNFAYLCGGFDGDQMFDDIWRLNLTDLQWTKMWQKIPQKIYFHTATTTPAGCMYVFGGVTTVDGGQRSNKVFKMWLKVPSLQELVWDKLSKHPTLMTNLATPEKRDHLRTTAGIVLPKKFYSRLD